VLFLFRKKGDSFWSFLYQIYVKGLVYNFHHLISLKQLEDLNRIIISFNFNKHGQLNLTYGTRIWKIEHFINTKCSLLWILCRDGNDYSVNRRKDRIRLAILRFDYSLSFDIIWWKYLDLVTVFSIHKS
jgi:hypothetical protein